MCWLLHKVLTLYSYSSSAHHVARELDIQEMEWPAVSPDLNPIEHVWDRLSKSVCGCPVPSQTLQDLEQALIEE